MILSYVLNIIRFKKWGLTFFVILFILGLKMQIIVNAFLPTVDQFLDLHKCPACYGTSACDYIDKVDIARLDILSALSYFFGVKNVFFGNLNNNQVILKQLAYPFEFEEFDKMLCEDNDFTCLCMNGTRRKCMHDINFYKLIEKEISLDPLKDYLSRLRLCKSTSRLKDLLHNIYISNKNVDRDTVDANILTLVHLNPEPLILQILSADENWPVPKYLGACGRLVIEEYVGLPLTAYYNAPWLLRAKIASSLLNAAYMFTFRNKDFGFYLTDVSADNIAVNSYDIAKFVDLENVIVVDKNVSLEERTTEWEQLHENTEYSQCPGCMIFSFTDICNHNISDHNYYAICQLLLSPDVNDDLLPGGLLHDIPAKILQKYSNIQYLLRQCAVPQAPQTRLSVGFQLKKLLDMIISELQ